MSSSEAKDTKTQLPQSLEQGQPQAPPPYSPHLVSVVVDHAVVERQDVSVVSLFGAGVVERCPVDVVCVIDLSISMDDEATLGGGGSATTSESVGLTILDVVVHAVKTVIAALSPGDRLAIVSFSDMARVDLGLTAMNIVGRQAASQTLSKLQTIGSTNIWAGIDKALEVLEHADDGGGSGARLCAMFLFTDGQPNVRPPAGEVAMLEKRRRVKFNGHLPCILNTFGFGYQLDSPLLQQLATIGRGIFAFIPDASFVGTVFVDATANILSAMAKRVRVTIEPINGAEVSLLSGKLILGGHARIEDDATAANATALTFELGFMQAFPKNIAFVMTKLPHPSTPYLRVALSFENVSAAVPKQAFTFECLATGRNTNPQLVATNYYRQLSVDRIRQATAPAKRGAFDESVKLIESLINDIKKAIPKLTDPDKKSQLTALLADHEGQVMQALSKDEYFNRWGKHYLLSLCDAHLTQQCNNFKDPGVQTYQSPLFARIRDELSELFIILPPPKPSTRLRRPTGATAASSRPSRVVTITSMRAYHDASAGCFSVNASVALPHGGSTRAGDLRRGDTVLTASGPSVIRAVLRTRSCENLMRLHHGGPPITPHHPVHLMHAWRFPIDLPHSRLTETVDVVSFLLEDRADSVIVDGVRVLTLAHGLRGDVVATHDFWGTERVVESMARLEGWDGPDGIVDCEGVVRDDVTGLVVGLVGDGFLYGRLHQENAYHSPSAQCVMVS